MSYNFLLLTFLSIKFSLYAQLPIDTLVISDKLLDYGVYFPARPCTFSTSIDKVSTSRNSGSTIAYIDSIKIGETVINKYNQQYYLVLNDSEGRKILEGDFFDEFANGHLITYYSNGNKKYEGDYLMKTYKRSKTVCKGGGTVLSKSKYSVQVGEWNYYSKAGEMTETKVMKD